MKLSELKPQEEYRVSLGQDAALILREPTNEEWAEYERTRMTFTRRGRMKEAMYEARCKLFDTIAVRVENIVADDGETPASVEQVLKTITGRFKSRRIIRLFDVDEDEDEDLEKN
jgi:hypothetical protein